MKTTKNKSKKIEQPIKEPSTKLSLKIITPELPTDDSKVLGIGAAEIQGDWVSARFSVEYLSKIIKALENLGIEKVDFVYSEDHPLIVGKLDAKKGIVTGIMLAPLVEDE